MSNLIGLDDVTSNSTHNGIDLLFLTIHDCRLNINKPVTAQHNTTGSYLYLLARPDFCFDF